MTNLRGDLMVLGDVIGLVVCVYLLVHYPDIEGEARGLLAAVSSYFGLGLRDAHQFEFGSSRGSKDKDALLGQR